MSLSRFDFAIIYRLGKQQWLFDTLSKQFYFIPKEGEAIYDQQWTILLKLKHLCLRATHVSIPVDWRKSKQL